MSVRVSVFFCCLWQFKTFSSGCWGDLWSKSVLLILALDNTFFLLFFLIFNFWYFLSQPAVDNWRVSRGRVLPPSPPPFLPFTPHPSTPIPPLPSKQPHSQTAWARDLTFWEHGHPPPHVASHMTYVIYHNCFITKKQFWCDVMSLAGIGVLSTGLPCLVFLKSDTSFVILTLFTMHKLLLIDRWPLALRRQKLAICLCSDTMRVVGIELGEIIVPVFNNFTHYLYYTT